MTQKRGLGRGLGALIPGAGTAPAPSQDLRTRSHPRTSPEAGEKGASTRPVDMFFSGDPVQSDAERPQRERATKQDLAGDMARAAAQRRGRGSNGTAASKSGATGTVSGEGAKSAARGSSSDAGKSGAGTKSTAPTRTSTARKSKTGTAKTGTAKAGTAKTSGTKTSTAKSGGATAGSATSGTAKTSAAKSSAATSGTATSGPAKAGAAKSGASSSGGSRTGASKTSTTKTGASKTSTTKTGAAEGSGTATDVAKANIADAGVAETSTDTVEAVTSAEQGSDATGITTDSPAVDVEAVESTPVAAQQEQQTHTPATSADAHDGLVPVPGAEFAEVPIHEIRENPRNPRTMFDEDELDELAESLQQVGVLQPVVIRPIPVTEDGESFELVMGERRWRAARRAGLDRIPAIIRETSDDDLLRDALLENLHRSQLNPLEEAAAYQQLLEDFGCTQEELSSRIGRSRPQITNTLRLMRLPGLVQRRLASGAISAGHARALLSLDDPSLMEELAQRIVQEGLSVRAVERLVARGTQPTATRTPRRSTYDPHVVDITSRLSNRLEAPVRIDVGKRKGKITLEFSTIEDLERLVERIGLDSTGDVAGIDDRD